VAFFVRTHAGQFALLACRISTGRAAPSGRVEVWRRRALATFAA